MHLQHYDLLRYKFDREEANARYGTLKPFNRTDQGRMLLVSAIKNTEKDAESK
jgi:hypothetical protein